MEFNELTRSLEEYRWALKEMGKCPVLNPIEMDILIYMALAAEEGLDEFNEARQNVMMTRPAIIASIIAKCSSTGFPMKWPENAPQN